MTKRIIITLETMEADILASTQASLESMGVEITHTLTDIGCILARATEDLLPSIQSLPNIEDARVEGELRMLEPKRGPH